MKLFSILLLALFLPEAKVCAQKPVISINAGLNFGEYRFSEPTAQYDNKFSVGLFTGVDAEVPMAPRMTVQSELRYAMFGSTYNSGEHVARYKSNYLMLPVLARYDMDQGVSFLCGPQVGLLTRARSILGGEKYDIRDQLRKTDFFLVFAMEYRMRGGVRFGLQYDHGLTDVDSEPGMSLKNRGFSLSMSYRLNGGFKEVLACLFKSR